MWGDAVQARVGLVLASDLIGRLSAVIIGDGNGEIKGHFGERQGGGVDQDGRAQAGLKVADVTLGGCLGEFVEALAAGF